MDRFDLEQAIMACWTTKDDIKLFAEKSYDLSEDELLNGLIGLEHIHNLRCEKVFDIFEELVSAGVIGSRAIPG